MFRCVLLYLTTKVHLLNFAELLTSSSKSNFILTETTMKCKRGPCLLCRATWNWDFEILPFLASKCPLNYSNMQQTPCKYNTHLQKPQLQLLSCNNYPRSLYFWKYNTAAHHKFSLTKSIWKAYGRSANINRYHQCKSPTNGEKEFHTALC